jgi:hypothetical protein
MVTSTFGYRLHGDNVDLVDLCEGVNVKEKNIKVARVGAIWNSTMFGIR